MKNIKMFTILTLLSSQLAINLEAMKSLFIFTDMDGFRSGTKIEYDEKTKTVSDFKELIRKAKNIENDKEIIFINFKIEDDADIKDLEDISAKRKVTQGSGGIHFDVKPKENLKRKRSGSEEQRETEDPGFFKKIKSWWEKK